MLIGLATLFVLAAAAAAGGSHLGPAVLTRAEADSVRRAIEADRKETREWLKSGATSYLATTQRIEFLWHPRLTVGSSGLNSVRLDDPAVQPDHLEIAVAGDSFRVEARHDSARFTVRGVEHRSATVGPGSIGVGRYTLRLSHQHYPAIIVMDPQSPRFADYKGIDYFPVDLAWRYVLPLTPAPRTDTLIIVSTRGFQRRVARPGWFDFMVGGTRCRLEVHQLLEPGVDESNLSVFFRDETTGKETYGVGRYLDPVALPDGRYVLDFNLAYNPACAYSEHYNCPIPPRANRLKVPVRAGEKDSHYFDKLPGP